MTRMKVIEIYAVILIFAFVGALLYIWMSSPLGTSDRVGITTAIGTVALVIVTGVYAWHTHKMVKEMREQRLSESRPYLLLRLEDLVKLDGDFDKLINAEEYEIPGNFKIKIRNEGTGPAINIITAFWRSDNVSPFQSKGYLARKKNGRLL